MPNKILVIGSYGQLASSIKAIADDNYIFIGKPQLNICNQHQLEETIEKSQANLVINCAAYTNVDAAESEPKLAYAVNDEAVKNLAILCNKNKLPLIHISTDYVFDGNKKAPYSELDIASPQTIYGKSKLAGENNIRKHLQQHIILRTSWLFSEYQTNFVKTMMRLTQTRENLSVVTDQIGAPTSAANLSIIIIKLANQILANKQSIPFGTYHYSDFPSVSWHQFAEEIFATLNNKFNIKTPILKGITSNQYTSPAVRPKNSCLNCSLIEQNFGITQINWQKSLYNCITNIIKL